MADGAAVAVSVAPRWAMRVIARLQAFLASPSGKYLWPPSRQSSRTYACGWGLLFCALYFGFIRTGRSKCAEWEKKRKREYAAASLKNLLEYEDKRVEEEKHEAELADFEKAEADAEAKVGLSPAATTPDAPSCTGDGGASSSEGAKKSSSAKNCAGGSQKKKPREPADAKRLLGLLIDDVENGAITKLGVDAHENWYQRAVALLKQRVEFELKEAIDNTQQARGICAAKDNDPQTLAKVEPWRDGEKLAEKLKLVREKVIPAMGRNLVDRALVAKARATLRGVKTQNSAAMKRIYKLFTPHAPRWWAGTLMLAFTEMSWGFLFGQMVSMSQLAYNLDAGTMARARRWSSALAVGFLFNWPLDNMGDTLVDSVQAKMQLGLRNAVMTSLLQQDREYFDHHASAVLQERLNKDTEDLSRTIIQQPKNLISATVRVLSKSMFLYAHSPPLFWLGISVPVPFCVLMNTIGWRLVRKSDRKISKVNDQAAGSTAEILREISTVRQFGMESEEGKRYRIVADWREQLEFSMLTLKRFVYFIMWMSFVFSRILNTYVGINYVTRGLLDAAKLLLCVYQFDGITWGVRQIVDLVPEVARLMQPLTRIATLLNSVPKIEPHPENPGKRLKPDKFIGCIEFQDVDFTYPSERQKQVLFGLSFVVEPRTKVAFVGKAGCGKSTSVTLVQRFYDSAKGSITVDGLPISDYDVHHLRRHIGVVAQDNVLFSTSIRENIIYGMGQGHLPAPTDEMVWAACDAANVTEFVRTFPNGLETFIGEKGVKLSGGQKQRLAIARAIIRTPTILLLDEATSALDSVNEKEVQRALDAMLQKHEGVAIVIAHRLTTIKNCNKIIVMEKGRKVEEGTHAELMAVDVTVGTSDDEGVLPILTGHYHKMWDTQMGEETFADVGLMSDEQLQLKLKYLEEESQRLGAEASKRGVRMPTASLDGDAS